MARQSNPNRTKTPIMIDKSLKLELNQIRNKSNVRQGNESDNDLLFRIIRFLRQNHPTLFHEPRTTYTIKTNNILTQASVTKST